MIGGYPVSRRRGAPDAMRQLIARRHKANKILTSFEFQPAEAPLPSGEGLGRGFGRSELTGRSGIQLHTRLVPSTAVPDAVLPPASMRSSSGASRHLLPVGEGSTQLNFETTQEHRADAIHKPATAAVHFSRFRAAVATRSRSGHRPATLVPLRWRPHVQRAVRVEPTPSASIGIDSAIPPCLNPCQGDLP